MDTRNRNAIPSPRQLIYDFVANRGVVSKAELLAGFSMTSSTMTRTLDEMVAEGLLAITGQGPSSGGRRPNLYEIRADYGYCFGLELSRRHSALGFFDMQMNPKSFTRWRMDEAMTPEQLVRHVAANVRAILSDHRIDSARVLGIGVGAVGPLDRATGTIVRPLGFPADGWSDVPICAMLTDATGLPARLENGANAALIGEQWAMRDDNPQHMLYVHAGVGLRSAMMTGGHIVHGSVDMEGAVGQMIVQADGPRLQPYGNYGALEAFASVQALEHKARADARLGRDELTGAFRVAPEAITFDTLLEALAEGSAYAAELFRQAACYFGIGLANLINAFHPESVIVGGALVAAYEPFYRTAVEVAQRNIYHAPRYRPAFSKGLLREDAVATGSALTVRRGMAL